MNDAQTIQPEGRQIEISREIISQSKQCSEGPRSAFKAKKLPEVERIRRMLSYNPETGVMIWLEGRREGCIAGTVGTDGYRWIKIDRKRYGAHRVAWLHFYGVEPTWMLDHKNTITTDNRIENLREATAKQNCTNVKAYGASGVKGAYWDKKAKRWRSAIFSEGKQIYLGSFGTKEEAAEAYAVKAGQLFGEFAQTS